MLQYQNLQNLKMVQSALLEIQPCSTSCRKIHLGQNSVKQNGSNDATDGNM